MIRLILIDFVSVSVYQFASGLNCFASVKKPLQIFKFEFLLSSIIKKKKIIKRRNSKICLDFYSQVKWEKYFSIFNIFNILIFLRKKLLINQKLENFLMKTTNCSNIANIIILLISLNYKIYIEFNINLNIIKKKVFLKNLEFNSINIWLKRVQRIGDLLCSPFTSQRDFYMI